MSVRVGDGASSFYGTVMLKFKKRAYLHLPIAGNFIKGQAVRQGSANGKVSESTIISFVHLDCPNWSCSKITSKYPKYVGGTQTCGAAPQYDEYVYNGASYRKGALIRQVGSGATGVVAKDSYGSQLIFTTTSGTFSETGGDLILSTPTENIEGTSWKRYGGFKTINATIKMKAETEIKQESYNVMVDVDAGEFVGKWQGAPEDVTVNGVNYGKPWYISKETGPLEYQPNGNTVVAYTTRTLVMPGEDVPELLCYDRCPKASTNFAVSCTGSDDTCYEKSPSILRNIRVDDEGSGCTGTPVVTIELNSQAVAGVTATGHVDSSTQTLVSLELTNPGTIADCSTEYTVKITNLTCSDRQPKGKIDCSSNTDHATGPQSFKRKYFFYVIFFFQKYDIIMINLQEEFQKKKIGSNNLNKYFYFYNHACTYTYIYRGSQILIQWCFERQKWQ